MAFGEEMRSISVAAISFVPRKFDLESNAEKLEQMFRRASAGGAQIAVAPEGILEGYVVNEIIAGKAAVEDMKRVAVAIDSPMIKRFRKLARELEMCLVFGFAERVSKDVFNSAVFIDDEGQVCGTYRKMQFAEGYHPSWWFNRLGRRSRAFDTPLGRCGILICNDRWNPRLAEIPALDGAQFLVIPSFGSRSAAQDQAVLARGKENGLPVIEANVGVTLVVNKGKIAVVDRQEEAVTFGTITVGPRVKRSRKKRDKVERAFLKWRETEMVRRYNRTQSRLKNDRRE
tara:strand:+ start:1702 stop:2562 length:861 start_codon:yes stop_codon:yes gene_type:complete